MRKRNLTSSSRVNLGICIGDPAGIGPEITAKALNDKKLSRAADIVLIGSLNAFTGVSGLSTAFLKRRNIRFIDLNNLPERVGFGKVGTGYGKAAVEYLNTAVSLLKNNEIDALVTAPVNKESICRAGYEFRGQTEYLADKFRTKRFLMLLASGNLRFGLVSRHTAIKNVPKEIRSAEIARVSRMTWLAMKELYGIKDPEIYVCALNPHASDGGMIGNEEKRIIAPALNTLRREIKHLYGPLPADTAVAEADKNLSSAVVAMYHDQALIPLKLTGEKTGVNVTYGLPFIRTSPLHGTAFDIAGKNIADPGSMKEAIRTALRCARHAPR